MDEPKKYLVDNVKNRSEYIDFMDNLETYKTVLGEDAFDDISMLVKMREDISQLLSKIYGTSIKSYLKELLEDYHDDILIYTNYNYASINYSYDKILSFYIQEERMLYVPYCGLLDIDFENRVIIVYDLKEQYNDAYEKQLSSIEYKINKINLLKEKLNKLKTKKGSIMEMNKEIYSRYSIDRNISLFKTLIKTTLCYLIKKYRIKLLNAFDDLVRKDEEYIQIQIIQLKKLQEKTYLEIYEEMCNLQNEIVERLQVLNFKVEIKNR
ncbi:hypothetical protein [Alkaliphilus sp. B6464]|uniref:hypothetical protein n=1 Tax=Alkaliphilus sp. B6464 TaxID=2731219 RepID=UPI001BA8D5C9|nr:hypothetical protein [Alkaliphilus sp. B6464]QUH22193.1 hypothetical protein HYG84_20005 [Alkaliphilus sp. B6464]